MPIVARTGNEAMAEAMRQINPDVVAAYPITPATEIVQIFASYVADGQVDTEFIAVESEHSAMSACIGASTAGARVMTGTSSQGLALMYEMLPIASGLRLPIVMCEVNRALSAPINIHCDHSDTMAARDFGWIQIFSENSQEAYDNVLQAVRIAEKTKLPVMVTTDGFIISHCMEQLDILEDAKVKEYVGEYKAPAPLLDVDHPISVGAIDLQDYYFEHRLQVANAMVAAKNVIAEVSKDFGRKFKREYKLIEEIKLDDAEVAIVCMGSSCGTAKVAIDELRAQGVKAGMLKIRTFRPLPHDEIAKALNKVKVVAVLDRADGINSFGGPVFAEIRSTMFDSAAKPKIVNYIYGLGGRDIFVDDIKKVYQELLTIKNSGKVDELVKYIGVRK